MRIAAGLSLADVMRQSPFTLGHYQRIERGILDVQLSTLVKLAQLYGVTLSELLDGL